MPAVLLKSIDPPGTRDALLALFERTRGEKVSDDALLLG